MKIDSIRIFNGWPTCSQENCDKPAEYSYVWTEEVFGCKEHTQQALGIANAIGFPTPERTLTQLVRPEELGTEESQE